MTYNPKSVTLVVTTSEQTRVITFKDRRRNSAEKQAAHWTKVWVDAGHKVERK